MRKSILRYFLFPIILSLYLPISTFSQIQSSKMKLNWSYVNNQSAKKAFENSIEINTYDINMLSSHYQGNPISVGAFGDQYPEYSNAKNEFERKKIEKQILDKLTARLNSLLNADNLIIKKDIIFGNYSFTENGFPVSPKNEGLNLHYGIALRIMDPSGFPYIGFGVRFISKNIKEKDYLYQYSDQYDEWKYIIANDNEIFPNFLPVSQKLGEQITNDYPNRILYAYILFKPIKNSFVKVLYNSHMRLDCKANYFIVFTPKGNVIGAFECDALEKIAQEKREMEEEKAARPQALLSAVYNNNIEKVKELLSKGTDINTKDNDKMTPLLIATEKGYIEIAKLLIEKGADINAKNDKGITALIFASDEKGDINILKLLLDKGADINAKDNVGYTALMWAVWNGKIEVVKLLLEKGADVNIEDKKGNTALMLAKQKDIANLIKQAGPTEIKDSTAVDKLIDELADTNNNVVDSAIKELGKTRDPRAIQPLINKLGNWSYPQQLRDTQWALINISKIEVEAVLEPLISIVKNKEKEERIREYALEIISEIDDPRIIEPILFILKNEGGFFKNRAIQALENIKVNWQNNENIETAIKLLISTLKEYDRQIRLKIQKILVKIGKPAIPLLVVALKDENKFIREYVASTLGGLKDTSTVEPLITVLLKDDYWGARESAAYSLGVLNDPRAIEPLISMLKDENKNVLKGITDSLGKLTQRNYGTNQEEWQNWWERNKK